MPLSSERATGAAIHHVWQRLPVPLAGLDSDNGSEFINHGLYAWCRRHAVTVTRSSAWKKNDSAHVEQKNGAVVRQLIGYDRFAPKAAMPSSIASTRWPGCTSPASNPSRSS